PETGVPGIIVLRTGKGSIIVITARAVVLFGLNKFFSNDHGVGGAILDASEGVLCHHGAEDAVSRKVWDDVERACAPIGVALAPAGTVKASAVHKNGHGNSSNGGIIAKTNRRIAPRTGRSIGIRPPLS